MEAYGQLVSTTDATSDPIKLDKNKFTIGRKPTSDLSLAGNKLISGSHGFVERDQEGRVWFHDTSTNGSLLNMNTKVSKDRVELTHGDEIHLVYRKADKAVNVAYLYQDMKQLAEEEMDCTQEYSSDVELDLSGDKSKISPVAKKRAAEPSEEKVTESEPSVKRHKLEDDGQKSEEKVEKTKEDSKAETDKPEAISDGKPASTTVPSGGGGEKATTSGGGTDSDGFEESLMCIICQEILHDCISLQPCMHSFCAGCYSDWMERSRECPSCRMSVDRINKNHIVNNLVDAYLKINPGKKRPEEDIKELDTKNKISRDMLYPTKKRRRNDDDDNDDDEEEDDDDDESVVDSDEETNVTGSDDGGMLTDSIWLGDDSDDDFTVISDSDDEKMVSALPVFTYTGGATASVFAPKTVCRQCPEYTGAHAAHGNKDGGVATTITTAATAVGKAVAKVVGIMTGGKTEDTDGAQPSTSTGASTSGADGGSDSGGSEDKSRVDVKVFPTPQAFTCTPYQTHILCCCCMQPMPDRRHLANIQGTNIPPTQCAICSRAFCHAYWGCLKADCMGCIGKFGELNFGKRSLNGLILDNVYESEVFKKYVESKKWSVKDVLHKCLQKLENKEYSCPDQNRFRIDSAQVVCFACGLRNFKELAYQLRRDIPDAELPDEVTRRHDCYWGRNCRTARNKPPHAQRFNHICDQTRTGT